MNKFKIVSIFTALSVSATAFFSGCTKNDTTDNNAGTDVKSVKTTKADSSKKIVFNLQRIPETMDPSLRTDVSASRALGPCMEGLVKYGKESGKMIPAAAESWELADDNLTWTFKLRKDAKWSNGYPLTAHDFVFSAKRALEPATGAQYSYQLYYIEGAKEFNLQEDKDFTKVGIKAIDDYTLQIKLGKPCTFFLQLLTNSIYYPINEKFYSEVENKFALNADKLIYNGPWKIKNWVHGGKFTYERNTNFWDETIPKTSDLEFLLIPDLNTAANMYRSGELDVTEISGEQLPQFEKNNNIIKNPSGVYYLQMNTKNRFFKNEKIRQAVSMAINREVFCKYVRKDGSIPGTAFVPTGVAGNEGQTFRDEFGKDILKYNPEKAKELLKEGLKEISFSGTMKVSLLIDQTDDRRRDAQFIQEELHKNLGINVVLEPNTFQSRIAKQSNKDFDFVYGGWLPDYNDPLTYIDLWYSTGGNNNSSWGDPEYDRLVDIASTSSNNKERMEAMAKAEQIMLKGLPVVPLYYTVSNWLVNKDLKDVIIRPVGLFPEFTYAYWK